MVFGFFTYPKRLNDLFADAVNVWLILGDEDALEIAANAVLTAVDEQRESMIHFAATALEAIEPVCISSGEDAFPTSVLTEQTVKLDTIRDRLRILLGKFEEIQGVRLLQARRLMRHENLRAVEKGDTTYFKSRYPDFVFWSEAPN